VTFIRAIWDELARPSTLPPGPLHGAYERAVIGMAHMVIGAALASLVAPEWASGAATARLVAAVYWLAKERADLKRGGTLADGLEDTACVGIGAWIWSPWVALALGLWLFWRGYASRNH
jgi:hypothetical protein